MTIVIQPQMHQATPDSRFPGVITPSIFGLPFPFSILAEVIASYKLSEKRFENASGTS